MDPTNPEHLAAPLRLALAYAPAADRPAYAAIFALDTRLSRIGSQASEPIIAQMKLAWWRDQFARNFDAWPRGEPLLQELVRLGLERAHLSALVDGWEALFAAETIGPQTLADFATGRAAGWLAVAGKLHNGCEQEELLAAGRLWALADIADRLPGDALASTWDVEGSDIASIDPAAFRSLRPLAVLAALALRAHRLGKPLLSGPASLGLAMRVGIFGR
ncbi:squalene/phytoene synthase family protein [Parerythrobacter aestuarii]|uniref:squalene/phytoene synthase family protein n=1 Tax=Parerythrobacter aestuarii TaxID=3020909 RepID=UPI0024DEF887|nr:squalene/phytoene synthase family protein [Parerythrobacter aestuarii]